MFKPSNMVQMILYQQWIPSPAPYISDDIKFSMEVEGKGEKETEAGIRHVKFKIERKVELDIPIANLPRMARYVCQNWVYPWKKRR